MGKLWHVAITNLIERKVGLEFLIRAMKCTSLERITFNVIGLTFLVKETDP